MYNIHYNIDIISSALYLINKQKQRHHTKTITINKKKNIIINDKLVILIHLKQANDSKIPYQIDHLPQHSSFVHYQREKTNIYII